VKQRKPRFAFHTRNWTPYDCLECGRDLYQEAFTTLSSCAVIDNDRASGQFIPHHDDTVSESYLAICHCILTQDPRVVTKKSSSTADVPPQKLHRALIITSPTTDKCKDCDTPILTSTVSGLTHRGYEAYEASKGVYKPPREDTQADTYIHLCPCVLTTDPRKPTFRRIFSDSDSD
jgi:hypothetical protein